LLRQTLRWLAMIAGCFGIGIAAGAVVEPTPAPAQVGGQPISQEVPAPWRDFARHVRNHLTQWLADETVPVQRFRASMEDIARDSASRPEVVARIWVAASGEIDRVEFDGLDDEAASTEMRSELVHGFVGMSPPADMPQPLRLKLALDKS
jgi:hypothetical protein